MEIKKFMLSRPLFFFLILLSAGPLKSGDAPGDFVKKQKGLIKDLYIKEDYFQSIAETRRLISYAGDGKYNSGYDFFILGNYFYGRQYKTVVYHLANKKNMDLKEKILLSQSYMRLGYFAASYKILKDIRYDQFDEKSRHNILIRKIEPMLLDSNYERAAEEIKESQPYVLNAKLTGAYSSLIKYRDMGYKSVPLAVSLSLIFPGAGQVYSGNFIHGFLSFLGVAAAGSGSYYYMKRGDRGLAFSLGFFTTIFYAGNIYGAYNTSENYNRELDRNFILEARRRFIPGYKPFTGSDLMELFK